LNKKHVGGSFEDSLKVFLKEDPSLQVRMQRHREKAVMAALLKDARKTCAVTQSNLSKLSGIPQSAIARMECVSTSYLPRINLYNRLLNAMGYRLVLSLEPINPSLRKKSRVRIPV